MKSYEFAKGLRKHIILENLKSYKDIIENTPLEDVTSPYWKEVFRLVAKLNKNQRLVVYQIMRQVMVDTISSLLILLDGNDVLPGVDGTFEICLDGQKISGDLQDEFLELEEDDPM